MKKLIEQTTIDWLLEGDPDIVYLTHRDLLGTGESLEDLQAGIASDGYGAALLGARGENGHWGIHYYQHKWTSTHYTLLDLKELGIAPGTPACREMVERMFRECQLADGGMNLAKSSLPSDAAVDGMVLNYSAWFCPELPGLKSLARALVPAAGFPGIAARRRGSLIQRSASWKDWPGIDLPMIPILIRLRMKL